MKQIWLELNLQKSFNSGKYIGKTKTLKNNTAKELIDNGFAVEFINDESFNQIVNNQDVEIKKSHQKEYDAKEIKVGRPKIKK